MKKFAIAHASMFDDRIDEVKIEVIEAETVYEALHEHSTVDTTNDVYNRDMVNRLAEQKCNLEEIKLNLRFW